MMDLGDVVGAVTSRLRLLPICLAIALAAAGAYILVTPKTYTATMSLLIDARERPPAGLDAAPTPQSIDPAIVESQTRLLTSRPVLRKAVEAAGLQEERGSALGELVASLRGIFERSDAPRGPEARIEAAVDRLEKSVTTKRGERTYVIDVDVKGRTRESAVRVAAAIADAFIAAQSRIADDLAKKNDVFFDAKIADLRARVEEAERKAQAYRQSRGLVVTDGRSSPEQRLKDANSALVAAQGKRADAEARARNSRAASTRDLTQPGGDALQSPVIEKLRGDYAALARDEAYAQSVLGPRHPTYLTIEQQLASVRAQIQAEQERIRQTNERDLKAARAAEESAAKLVASLEAKTNQVDDERVGLNELDRAAATLRTNYEKALSARENVRKDAVPSPTAVLIDPPTAPAAASSPKTLPALLAALGGGVNLWIIAALLGEYRSRRARSAPSPASARDAERRSRRRDGPASPPDDAPAGRRTSATRPAAATDFATPDIWRERVRAASETWRDGPARFAQVATTMRRDNPYSRAVETILADLRESLRDAELTPAVCVLADQPGDGATTLALSLAHAACNVGERVLLIDYDADARALTDFCAGFRTVPARALAQAAHLLRSDADGGEIICLSFADEIDVDEALEAIGGCDIAILDCGTRPRRGRALTRLEGTDVVLLAMQAGREARAYPALKAEARDAGLMLATVATGVERAAP
jgi:uncharacterized protein involved in exopolysaccharide biosynthesis